MPTKKVEKVKSIHFNYLIRKKGKANWYFHKTHPTFGT